MLFNDGTLTNYIIDSYASEWLVLHSQIAHKENIKSYSIIDSSRLKFYENPLNY